MKIELLLEDVFRRQKYTPSFIVLDSSSLSNPKSFFSFLQREENRWYLEKISLDSSMYFTYLCSDNIKIPDRDFYIHWSGEPNRLYCDSVKLKVINDPKMKNKHADMIGIGFLEVNKDTTIIKIVISYGSKNDIAEDERTYTYSFDEKNCKWIVLDSTLWQY